MYCLFLIVGKTGKVGTPDAQFYRTLCMSTNTTFKFYTCVCQPVVIMYVFRHFITILFENVLHTRYILKGFEAN